jgi:O-antigen/teichoic acid export membrane protein
MQPNHHASPQPEAVPEADHSIRDVGWMSGSLATRQGLAFVTTVLAGRLLPTAEFADYLVAVSAAVILIPLVDAGMLPVVMRTAARNPATPLFGFVRRAFEKRAPFWLVVGLGLITTTSLIQPSDTWLVVLAFAAAVGQANLDGMCGELFGRRRFPRGGSLLIASAALGVGGMTVLLFGGRTAAAAMIVFAGARILPPLLAGLAVRPPAVRAPEISWRVSYSFGLIAFLQVLYIRSDILLLSAFGTAKATIAVYGVLYNVLIATQLIPSGIAWALYPRIAAASEGSWQRFLRLGLSVSFLITILACATLFISPPLVVSVFGSHYSHGVTPLRTLLLAILPLSISLMAVSAMQGRDKERILLKVTLVVLVTNIGGNLLMIPLLGARGAIIATMTAEILAAAGSLAIAGPDFWRKRSLWPVALVALAIGLSFGGLPSIAVSITLVTAAAALVWADSFGIRDALGSVRLLSGARHRVTRSG